MGTLSAPSSTLCLTSGVTNRVFFLDKKGLELKGLLWQQHLRALTGKYLRASFKNTALIFLEILFIHRFTIFSCKQ